jgi:hypothetical protein
MRQAVLKQFSLVGERHLLNEVLNAVQGRDPDAMFMELSGIKTVCGGEVEDDGTQLAPLTGTQTRSIDE